MIRLKSLLNENVDLLTMPNINKGLSLANALIKRGFTKEHAAAIIGNVWAESAFNHTSLGSGGDFGLMQWLGPRKKALKQFADKQKSSVMNLTTQLDFIKYELLDKYDGEYAYETNQFRKAMSYGDSILDKAEGFARYVERPKAGALEQSLPTRRIIAQQIYDFLNPKKKSTRDKQNQQATSYTAVTYSSDNPPYIDLLKNPIPKLIASVIKQSRGTFNDYEAWAEAAFAAIKTKSKYAQVTKILGQDAYAYVKDFMNTGTKYHKQPIDISYKALT
jgi:6-pyruvoyl-tetrahydropterin synthase